MTDVDALLEDTELTPRLEREFRSVLEDRDVEDEDVAAEILQAVEHQYRETRVDPLDPVGTVSAQSIGEPGTQMSIPGDEEVLVRRHGETRLERIDDLVERWLAVGETRRFGDHEVGLAPGDLEAASLGEDESVSWASIEAVSRHGAPDELLEIELESGRSIRATEAHSFVTRTPDGVEPVAGADLEAGDWLPVAADLDVADGTETLDLRAHLPAGEHWFASALADGGVAASSEHGHPGGEAAVRHRRQALEAGDLEADHVYPSGSSVGLPERFPLDAETGFFVGAYLAEGHCTDQYVSVSNVDAEFRERVHAFAERFDLTTHEYDNDSGFAESTDVRVNGTILVDVLRTLCHEGGEKRVPAVAFGADGAFVRGLLSGYLAGDGNVADGAVRASGRDAGLIEDLALLLSRLGVHARLSRQGDSRTLRVPTKHVSRLAAELDLPGERGEQLATLAETVDPDGPDATDQVPAIAEDLRAVASEAGIPTRQVNAAANRDRVGRTRLEGLVGRAREAGVAGRALENLERGVAADVVWERIERIERVPCEDEYVYDLSVAGLETFTTGQGVVTHNTMNTFHYAGVAEIDVTLGLPRLIELVDARKEPDTPTMTVYLDGEYATDRERAHEVVWQIEATKILALGDISTNVAEMTVDIDLNEETLEERWPTAESVDFVVDEIAETIESELDVETDVAGTVVSFGPPEPSYRQLLQLVQELREVVFRGIEDVTRVVVRKEELDDGEEFVLYTEGSAFGDVLDIEGVDATRTTTNSIHEIRSTLGIEAAREAIIDETMDTLEEQGLGDVNVRHLMLVADTMTNGGEIESIGRHGIAGDKESVLARATFEVTVNHLLDAATYGEVDDLDGVLENVIVGKPIKLGTGDVNLRMGARSVDD